VYLCPAAVEVSYTVGVYGSAEEAIEAAYVDWYDNFDEPRAEWQIEEDSRGFALWRADGDSYVLTYRSDQVSAPEMVPVALWPFGAIA